MATATASPQPYDDLAESPLDQDDILYPCKGCGEILEEGKAFELAGNRWHIDCFRCNTCGTLLDSDANLLLLGDGSLICNNCTYSCNACGNKIEDLAILTGDQAFCASCFRCRNCKRKIENLRYARTSQGIFCMSCHEALMARRRKKSRTSGKTPSSQTTPSSAPFVLDKSLPALPSTAAPPLDNLSPSETVYRTTNELSPQLPSSTVQKSTSYNNARLETSPSSMQDNKGYSYLQSVGNFMLTYSENLTLPSSTYTDTRHSNASSRAEGSGEVDNDFFIPVVLDPSPGPSPGPQGHGSISDTVSPEQRTTSRDYFGGSKQSSGATFNDNYRDIIAGSSRSASAERGNQRMRGSPHIAYQEKGRQPSSDVIEALRRQNDAGSDIAMLDTTPSNNHNDPEKKLAQPLASEDRGDSTQKEPFILQDAPKWKRSSGSKTSPSNQGSPPTTLPDQTSTSSLLGSLGPISSPAPQIETTRSPQPSLTSGPSSSNLTSPTNNLALSSTSQPDRPKREDSLKSPITNKAIARKELPRASETELPSGADIGPKAHERKHSGSSNLGRLESLAPSSDTFDGQTLSNSNRAIPPTLLESNEEFIDPRNAPPPPQAPLHQHSISLSSVQSDMSPSTPVPSSGATIETLVDADSNKGLRGDDVESHSSVFRRVSNAVKHGRSLSDRGGHVPASPKWTRSTRNGSMDISSPIMASPDSREDISHLRNRLKFSQQRIAELEAERINLQEQVNGTVEIRQVNTELREKRSTMAFLDTQREMVVRELEVLTEHLQHAKDTDEPVNIKKLKSETLKDFANSLQKLKDGLGSEIEDLMQQKNQLTADISNLIQMKDKGFQEYENLSTKNTQLAELNGQLVHSIQELYKQGRQANGGLVPGISSGNGLGIYTNNSKDKPELPGDSRNVLAQEGTGSQFSGDTEIEPATVLTAPQVVNIRKGQPKKFNWKKGGHAVAKNVTKGFKGAFGGTNQSTGSREDSFDAGLPYGSIASGPLPTPGGADQGKQPWSFLAQKVTTSRPGQALKDLRDNSSASLPTDALFGSELEARTEFEKRVIPNIVTTCIAEVELRGMTAEGIYRKSGSTSLVNTIKLGFESTPDYDISDPDLDIHAVTSTLKQYFRKLPTPLISYDCYDGLLEAAAEEDEDTRADNIREAVDSLPKSHRDCLEFLVFHLVRVMERESQNLMTPHNLAVIFAPTIMRPLTIEREMSDMQAQRAVVLCLIQQNKSIFGSQE